MLFAVSGNGPPAALKADLDDASADRTHYVVNLRIDDHTVSLIQRVVALD
jgi:hypothetical protein